MIRLGVQYINAQGGLTKAGWDALSGLDAAMIRLAEVEAKLAAIADVASPTGGATTDTQARAAIVSIIAAAS